MEWWSGGLMEEPITPLLHHSVADPIHTVEAETMTLPRRLPYLWSAILILALLPLANRPLHAGAAPPVTQAELLQVLQQGLQAYKTGRYEDALRLFNEALEQSIRLKDKQFHGLSLYSIGGVYDALGQPQKALAAFTESLPLHRAAGDKRLEAATLSNMGRAYADVGEPQKALDHYQQALLLDRALGDKGGEARTLTNIGQVYQGIGEPQKALSHLEQALLLDREAGDRKGEANTLGSIGQVYDGLGKSEKALDHYEQALTLHRALGDKKAEANILISIGGVYDDLGDPHQGLEYYNQVLLLLPVVRDRRLEATTLGNIGFVHHGLGQPQKALEYSQQALLLHRAVGNKKGEGTTLNNIGFVYGSLGQPQKALEYYQQALPLHQAIGDKRGQARTLNNIGFVYKEAGQSQKALEYYEQALLLHRMVGDRRSEATTLGNISGIDKDLGQPQKALEHFEQALLLDRSVGNQRGEAVTLNNIGLVYHDLGQPEKARGYYEQALLLARAVGYEQLEAAALSNTAILEEEQGHPAGAEGRFQDALSILEGMRESLGGLSEFKASFLQDHLYLYHRYINFQVKQSQPATAFTWLQKTKARALLDLMYDGKVDVSGALTADERAEERRLKLTVAHHSKELIQAATRPSTEAAQLTLIKQQVASAEGDLQKFTDALYVRYPELARKRAAQTLSLAEVARLLPEDTALLEYGVLKAHKLDRTVLCCVTVAAGQPVLQVYPVEKRREELTELTDDFRDACADPEKNYRVKSRDLYRVLIGPAAKQLAGKKRLVICPDGPLWGLPFQALLAGGQGETERFLAEEFEIAYAYSATAAHAALRARSNTRRTKPAGTLLALANPDFSSETRSTGAPAEETRPIFAESRQIFADARRDVFSREGGIKPLPGTQKEAEALKAAFPDATVRTGKQAQEGPAKGDAGKFRYLHFATHGLFNDAAPLMSSVVLATPAQGSPEDGFLTAREIFDLDLTAEMVVLSACDTARGEKRAGEGVVGLTWALFVAGSPTQVLSQWAVSDASTAELMRAFYQQLKQGKTKGAALREASLGLLKDGRHSHPYYWAPFVLIGDWR
jgi:tetratricopeptide (TPR) repeat protein/CHAT domain-containing protein